MQNKKKRNLPPGNGMRQSIDWVVLFEYHQSGYVDTTGYALPLGRSVAIGEVRADTAGRAKTAAKRRFPDVPEDMLGIQSKISYLQQLEEGRLTTYGIA